MKSKKTLSTWLTNKYLLIIRNEENFAEKTTFSFNYAKLSLFIFFIAVNTFMVSFYLSTTLLAKWFDPRHKEVEMNKRLADLSIAVDSLESEVENKERFILTLKKIMEEDPSLFVNDSSTSAPIAHAVNNKDVEKLDPVDVEFRENFEKEGYEVTNVRNDWVNQLQYMFFLSPISGVISSKYDAKIDHYGVDIVSQKNEPVRAITDGSVVISSWTQDSGYVIAIQHKNNIISVYKHNSALLKKVGNFVKAGDIVSIIGNTGELTNGPHLHFELWYDGYPINPEEFVSF